MEMWKNFSLSVPFILILLVRCLQGRAALLPADNLADSNQVNCGHNYQSNCLIEATFSPDVLSNETIDVLVNCSSLNSDYTARPNQFSVRIERVVWNGCYAMKNLRFFGLMKIASRKDVKMLTIERFAMDTIEPGTFNDFTQLKILSLELNSIEYLLSSCFTGLENLLTLRMMENNLKRLGPETFSVLPKLNTLQIDERALLIANHQFSQYQAVENAVMDIYNIEIDIIKSFLNHVRNLSIFSSANGNKLATECVEMNLNGRDLEWIIENLAISNFQCESLSMGNVESLTKLAISRSNFFNVKLEDLKNLRNLTITFSRIKELPTFIGDFKEIEVIDLSYNDLTAINMSTFQGFTKLKELNFIGNNINVLSDYPNSLNIHIHLDYNSLDCEWLASIGESPGTLFSTFIYERNFKFINVNGLPCSLHQAESMRSVPLSLLSTQYPYVVLGNNTTAEIHDENFNVRPKIFAFIICCAILLGIAITYILLYVYNRISMLKHQPFYHMLRDSFVRPICTARETLASDFKGIIFRNLPPTNYEHPISSDGMEETEMSEMNENIYEEIPQKEENS